MIGFIIIWGHKWRFRTVQGGWHGSLHCPQCGTVQPFQEMQPVKYFTLYWIPLFPTSRGDPFVQCRTCGGKFNKPQEIEAPAGPA